MSRSRSATTFLKAASASRRPRNTTASCNTARRAEAVGKLPTKVLSLGGRFLFDGPDQAQTPNMQLAVMEFGNGGPILLFEVRGLTTKHPDFPQDVSNKFYTSEGVIKEGGGGRRGEYMF